METIILQNKNISLQYVPFVFTWFISCVRCFVLLFVSFFTFPVIMLVMDSLLANWRSEKEKRLQMKAWERTLIESRLCCGDVCVQILEFITPRCFAARLPWATWGAWQRPEPCPSAALSTSCCLSINAREHLKTLLLTFFLYSSFAQGSAVPIVQRLSQINVVLSFLNTHISTLRVSSGVIGWALSLSAPLTPGSLALQFPLSEHQQGPEMPLHHCLISMI